jgi:hypothetical protein
MSTMEQQISKTLNIEVLSRSFKGTMVASIGNNNIHWDSSENVDEPLKWHKFEESYSQYSQCIAMIQEL